MINAGFFMARPVPFKDICLVYPPLVKDILDEPKYPLYRKILLSTQEDIEDEYTENNLPLEAMVTPFQKLLDLSTENDLLTLMVKDAFRFFIHESVIVLADQGVIIIGDIESLKQTKNIKSLKIINEENFFEFQNLVRQSLGEKVSEPYQLELDPRIRNIKAKARYRDRVKAQNGKGGMDLGATLASICCMNLGINPLNIGELSYASIPILIRYYQEKSKYEIDIQSLLAGADPKKVKPQNWMRNIEDL